MVATAEPVSAAAASPPGTPDAGVSMGAAHGAALAGGVGSVAAAAAGECT
jgi:hypothetical protein